jgi:hypothetical protein
MTKATSDPMTYEACVPFSLDVEGVPRTVRVGEIMAGDDPALIVGRPYCCAAGTPHAERPHLSDVIGHGVHTEPGVRRPDGWRRPR